MRMQPPETDLTARLARWVAAGLIDARQAAAIEAAETAPPAVPGPLAAQAAQPAQPVQPAQSRKRKVPLIVEALGYAGGALAVIAGVRAAGLLLPSLSAATEAVLAAAAAAALGITAAAIRPGGEPAFRRLVGVLWLMSTVCLATAVGLLAGSVWHLGDAGTGMLTSAAAGGYAAVLWWRTRAALQELSTLVGAAGLVSSAIYLAAPGVDRWAPGLGVWLVSLLWGAGAVRGYLGPRLAGYIGAGAGLLTGAQLTMGFAAGHALALLTVAGLLTAGVVLRQVWVLGLGTIGVMMVVPQTAGRYLPQSVGSPLAVFVIGLILLGVALWLARGHRGLRPRG
jgi:hypothetical protein